ncbi:hypothetical protein [Coleofasciculus sp. G3-WIS-01]|uniref:hypothetical protein n=1 Tax=Coleofasciculus sp. G3-WIS-01 TaxID=3069528 RepID=UPI00406309D3
MLGGDWNASFNLEQAAVRAWLPSPYWGRACGLVECRHRQSEAGSKLQILPGIGRFV